MRTTATGETGKPTDPKCLTDGPRQRNAFPAGAACICFCAFSALLLRAYGLLHWRIIGDHYATLEDPMKSELFRLLGYLSVYHVTALVAVGFGVWTFRSDPRWVRWVCLPFTLASALMFFVVM